VKVLFDHPNPFLLAHGGFQTQIEQTKKALQASGVEVEWLRWWDNEQKGDLIHYFGRAHPAYIQQAQIKGFKVVMSELLTGLGSRSATSRKLQKLCMIVAGRVLPKEFTARLCWDAYKVADATVALTSWEKKLMIEMFSAKPGQVHVVPNGVEDAFFRDSNLKIQNPKSKYLVCAATITERKRVVELAEAAILAHAPVYVIGKPYSKEDSYYKKFVSVVESSKGLVKYEGGISDRAKMAKIYKSASGFVLLSSMESLSLSALEAAAGNCPLLLADLPWARSTFGNGATYCQLGSWEQESRALKDFYKRIDKAPRAPLPCRWSEVGAQLKQIYGSLLADKTSR
jgi:glycosyltransferase involved in cell wall biosynthesis